MQPAASTPNKLTADAPYTAYHPATVVNEPISDPNVPTDLDEKPPVAVGDADFPEDDVVLAQNDYTYRNAQYTGQTPSSIQAMPTLPPLKAAILLPLSGPHEDIGQAMLQAAQLALFDMGYDDFELMPRDTKGTRQGATKAMQDAINDGVQIVMGPLFSESVSAVKPLARRNNINVLAFSTDWTLAGDNTFIMGFLPFAQVQRVTEFAINNGYEKIGILAPNTDYGNSVIAAYNSMAYRNGIKTAKVMKYTPGLNDTNTIVRDFTSYDDRVQILNNKRAEIERVLANNPKDPNAKAELASLKNANSWPEAGFDAVLLPTGGDEARAIANMLSYFDLGPEIVKRLGTGLWDEPGLATEPALKDAWFAASDPALRADFENRYRNLYGLRPQRLATLAYDATALTAVLAKNSYFTRGAVKFEHRDFLNPNGFAGIDGIFRFRPDGLIERGLAVLEYKDGRIEVIDPAPRTFQQK